MWKYKWFQDLIAWCRKWKWFDTYIYGKSFNLEDFVRNPAEVLRDTYFPFIVKDVKAYSLLNLRCGYIAAQKSTPNPQVWIVPMGDRKLVWSGEKWTIVDLRIFNPWWTKFCNAIFFAQIAVSMKWKIIPIPYISLCIKIAPWYFQFGLGWGAEVRYVPISDKEFEVWYDAVLCAKFRFVNERTSNEAILNPSDVLGYFEGTI